MPVEWGEREPFNLSIAAASWCSTRCAAAAEISKLTRHDARNHAALEAFIHLPACCILQRAPACVHACTTGSDDQLTRRSSAHSATARAAYPIATVGQYTFMDTEVVSRLAQPASAGCAPPRQNLHASLLKPTPSFCHQISSVDSLPTISGRL